MGWPGASFLLHAQLTHEIEGDWYYQGVDTFGATLPPDAI